MPCSPQRYTVTFDALLVGHDAGVTSLSWRPSTVSSVVPTLLSTSTDSSLILWAPSKDITSLRGESTSLWINKQRFGDIGGQRLGGFVGGLWASSGRDVLAWGWGGGWRRWRCPGGVGIENQDTEGWSEVSAITGHNGPVKSLDWSPEGEYVISVGFVVYLKPIVQTNTQNQCGSDITYPWPCYTCESESTQFLQLA